MTTISWDGSVLATDSRATADGVILSDSRKKLYDLRKEKVNKFSIYGEKILAIAFCGASALIDSFLHHALDGKLDEYELGSYEDKDISGIAISSNYVFRISTTKLHCIKMPLTEIVADGSGHDFALSAMRLGLTAEEAIRHAITLDSCSGGEVQSVRLFK